MSNTRQLQLRAFEPDASIPVSNTAERLSQDNESLPNSNSVRGRMQSEARSTPTRNTSPARSSTEIDEYPRGTFSARNELREIRLDVGGRTLGSQNATWWNHVEVNKEQSKSVRRFYKRQNALLKKLQVYHRIPADEEPGSPSVSEPDREDPGGLSVAAAIRLSFALNIVLLILKLVAAVTSGSMTIIASAADSVLDLISGFVLFLTQRAMTKRDPTRYPQGKTRIEPVGVIVFSVVMGLSSLQIIIEAVKRMFAEDPSFELDAWSLGILGGTIVSKLLMHVFCKRVAATSNSAAVEAYADDHFNDVMTNGVGVVAVVVAFYVNSLWFLDPLGAILIALWIMGSWCQTGFQQSAFLTGKTAPPEFLKELTYIACHHDQRIIAVDTVRAYHFGVNFLVEVDIVLPAEMPLRETHDIGESLQIRLEQLSQVERAFVHNDFEWSHPPEHKHV